MLLIAVVDSRVLWGWSWEGGGGVSKLEVGFSPRIRQRRGNLRQKGEPLITTDTPDQLRKGEWCSRIARKGRWMDYLGWPALLVLFSSPHDVSRKCFSREKDTFNVRMQAVVKKIKIINIYQEMGRCRFISGFSHESFGDCWSLYSVSKNWCCNE